MAQKLLIPFKKLPQQIHNLPLFQKLQDLTTGRHSEHLHSFNASIYGILEHPVSLAYDQDLCLLAVGYANGHLEIYGTPRLSFRVDCNLDSILFIEFLRNEGRLIVATESSLVLLELDTTLGSWEKHASIDLPFSKDEKLTSMVVGKGVIYVGSSAGTLRQVAVEAGRMSVGDDELTSLPCHLILNKISNEQIKESLKLESSQIVSIQPYGEELLVGFSGGTVLITKPQPIPLPVVVEEQPADAITSTLVSKDVKEEEKVEEEKQEKKEEAPITEAEPKIPEEVEQSKEEEPKEKAEHSEQPAEEKKKEEKKRTTGGHDRKHLQAIKAEATKKFRTLSKTIKSTLLDKDDAKEKAIPPLPVAPSPRITYILPPHSSAVQLRCATWRVSHLEGNPDGVREVLAAYDDGAHLTWKLPKPIEVETEEESEPSVLTNQEVASIPYGPLPCAAIERILALPSSSGVITAFVGGLPRAQHGDKHTLSVLRGRDEHVCFQFSSAIRDLVILPPKRPPPPPPSTAEPEAAEPSKEGEGKEEEEQKVDEEKHTTLPATPLEAAYVLVLTEQELIAIDLTEPAWPVIPSPYLQHLHTADVTAVAHSLISSKSMSHLRNGFSQSFSNWPVEGGKLNLALSEPITSSLLALGRSNGVISLYEVSSGDCFSYLGHLDTLDEGIWEDHELPEHDAETSDHGESRREEDEAWPPFRRVGHRHHDHCGRQRGSRRHAIHFLSLNEGAVEDEVRLMVGGGAGNLSVWSTSFEPINPATKVIRVDLLADNDRKLIWEGTTDLVACNGIFNGEHGSLFGPTHLIQMHPPTPITAGTFAPSNWNAMAVGSQLGFAVIDLLAKTPTEAVAFKHLTHKCPVSCEDGATAPVGKVAKMVAQGRLIRDSLQSSFRKLRKPRIRTTPSADEAIETAKISAEEEKHEEVQEAETKATTTAKATASTTATTAEAKPEPEKAETVEEKERVEPEPTVEEEPEKLYECETAISGVQCLLFADTFPDVSLPRAPVLLVGTRGGLTMIHRISWPENEGALVVEFVKEVRLKHAAPVIGLFVLDANLKAYRRAPPPVSERSRQVAEPRKTVEPEEPAVKAPVAETEGEEAKEEAEIKEPTPKPDAEAAAGKEESDSSKPAAKLPECSHELLICTDEQVKVLAMPSLKPKYKYRFWGAQGDHSGEVKTVKKRTIFKSAKSTEVVAPLATPDTDEASPAKAVTVEADEAAKPKTDETGEVSDVPDVDSANEFAVELTPEKATKECLRRVAAFSLHHFVPATTAESASPSPTNAALHVIIALRNGCIVCLELPTLRRVLKVYCCERAECREHHLLKPGISSNSGLIFWPLASGQVVANELAFNPVSLHIATEPGLKGPGYALELPEWARPKPAVPPTTLADAPVGEAEVEVVKEIVETEAEMDEKDDAKKPVEKGNVAAVDMKRELLPGLNGESNTTQQVESITRDSIKDYLNDGSGANVTVQTTESSLEKHTVIQGGNVVTTVHETERVDGEVTKDDLVQIKSSAEDTRLDESALISGAH